MLCPVSSFDIRSFLSSRTILQLFMASPFSPRLLLRRLLTTARSRPPPLLFSSSSASCPRRHSPILEASVALNLVCRDGGFLSLSRASRLLRSPSLSRVFFSTRTSDIDGAQGPAVVDYRSVLAEDEFHRLADATIHDLQEKLEEYGDSVQIDGYDIDYGNQVLTLKLGSLGTYVINKQTPNRQIWLSSPVSGPARFDWDVATKSWMYRRTKANLLQLLEEELQQLCANKLSTNILGDYEVTAQQYFKWGYGKLNLIFVQPILKDPTKPDQICWMPVRSNIIALGSLQDILEEVVDLLYI